jgi:hypothetical protein
MASVRQLSGETELAMIKGTKMTSFFTKASTKVVLTNKRVYQEIESGANEESCIIPLRSVDSFGLMTSSKTWLLVLGAIVVLFGLYSLFTSNSKSDAFIILIIGAIPIAVWWFTRKIGAVVYSLSGKTELFVLASAGNMGDITTFIAKIQETLDNNKEGLDMNTQRE